jgi:methionine-gamma-lyase
LQEKLKLVHNTEDCVALASGVAALAEVFFAFLNSGKSHTESQRFSDPYQHLAYRRIQYILIILK